MKIIHAEAILDKWKVAIVVSRFNETVTKALCEGAITRLQELGLAEKQIVVTWVPGAVEIPLIAKQFAASSDFDAVIALGAVIRGETSHYDYVCQQVSYGCQRLALEMDKPIIFGVLTTENEEQAMDRAGGQHGNKGRDCADCAYEMVSVMSEIKKQYQ